MLQFIEFLAVISGGIYGVNCAIEAHTSLFVATLFGVMTGSFGGVIGDVVCNEVPNLFRTGTPLYATCSFLGCWGRTC